MNDVTFAHEWVLYLLAAIPLIAGAWVFGMRRAVKRARRITRGRAGSPPYAAMVLLSLAACAAIVSAAQPRWGTRESQLPRTGADLIVVMDISRSMDAVDVAPNRLEAAKAAVNTTLTRLGGDRLGLVVFGGTARLRFPLTTDLTAATQVISALETGVVFVEGGSSAAAGIDIALSVFDEERESGRVILLITDGDDLGGDPAATALRVRDAGVNLLVAGAGTAEGAPVPVVDPATRRVVNKLDANGAPIITKLNEPFLRALAAAAGGRYAGSDLSLVPGAVDGRLRALESAQFDSRPTSIPVERYQWFAGAALALLVLGSIAERFLRMPWRAGVATAVLLVLLPGCATAAHSANETGRDALSAGDTETAINAFLEAQTARPDDPKIALNLAAAYHAAGRYEEAILAARRALAANSSEQRARAFASIGHHQFASQRLTESLEAFRRALIEDSDDEAARHDYEVVLRIIENANRPPGEQENPPGSQPGAGPTPQPGEGPPGQPVPGEQTPPPGPGAATPPAGGTPPPGSAPQPGQSGGPPTSAEQIDKQLEGIDQQVARVLADAGETPSASQALEILRLLAERSRIAAQRDALGGGGNPRDY